jgi:hypothetical protein
MLFFNYIYLTNISIDFIVIEMSIKTTRYFKEQILRKRSYLKMEWCIEAINNPLKTEVQHDGRIRHWVYIREKNKYLRVVTLKDGKTIHNAFFDRRFKE